MLGEAISRFPFRLSLTPRKCGRIRLCEGPPSEARSNPFNHGDQALRDAALAPIALGAPDARAQGPGPQDGLAPPRALAGPAPHARLPRRHGAGDEDRRPQAAELPRDLEGAGRAPTRAAALPRRPRA